MQTYSTPAADLLFVGVPEDAKNITLLADAICFNSEIQDPYCTGGDIIKVSPGYSLLFAGTADGITEEEAGKVVQSLSVPKHGVDGWPETKYYMRYIKETEFEFSSILNKYPFKTATESLLSLLRSLNLNPSETVVLFKKKK